MRVSTKTLHITCHPNQRNTVEIGKRTFDADRVKLKTTDGKLIAKVVTCNLFALPATVNIEAEPNAELFDVGAVAKKVGKRRKDVEAFLRHRRIGRKFGNEKLFTEADVWTVGREMKAK